ncbi:hypothetical protein VP01_192g1 [Puccinia sorghi]|uniref:Integrase catalytic domain-containing protein n=1 Tax=Puccinia sorghi TaxID=27349 RepID=A0A0L6VEA7_9BASI|nr:hypothetical protein VP01_192g1 [Puccinia sorghi]
MIAKQSYVRKKLRVHSLSKLPPFWVRHLLTGVSSQAQADSILPVCLVELSPASIYSAYYCEVTCTGIPKVLYFSLIGSWCISSYKLTSSPRYILSCDTRLKGQTSIQQANCHDRNQQETNLDRSAAVINGSIGSQIRDEDCLAADGSNYAAWCDFIDKRMRDAVNKPLFYHRPNYNSIHEHIGQSILLSLEASCRFNSISRAAQINTFRWLISFNISNHTSTALVLAHLNELTIHIKFTHNDLAGLVLQNGLASNPQLVNEFNHRTPAQWSDSSMSFVLCMQNHKSAKRPHQLNPHHNHNIRTIPRMLLISWLSKLDCAGSAGHQTTCCVTVLFVNIPTLAKKTTSLLEQTTGNQTIPPMVFNHFIQLSHHQVLLEHIHRLFPPASLSTINNSQPHQPNLPIGRDLNIVFKESTRLPFEEDHQAWMVELGNVADDLANISFDHVWILPHPIYSMLYQQPSSTLSSSCNTMPNIPIPDCCPVFTDLRVKLKNETFVTPLHIDKPHSPLTDMRLAGVIRCNICNWSKSTQRNSLSKSDRIEKKLEIITADIIGPFEVDTFNKGRFTLTICDIATSFSEKVLASKDQAEQLLVDTIQRWKCQTGCLVKSPDDKPIMRASTKQFLILILELQSSRIAFHTNQTLSPYLLHTLHNQGNPTSDSLSTEWNRGTSLDEITFTKQELTFKQAQQSKHWIQWKRTINEELGNLKGMQVWSVWSLYRQGGNCGSQQ